MKKIKSFLITATVFIIMIGGTSYLTNNDPFIVFLMTCLTVLLYTEFSLLNND